MSTSGRVRRSKPHRHLLACGGEPVNVARSVDKPCLSTPVPSGSEPRLARRGVYRLKQIVGGWRGWRPQLLSIH